MGKSLRMLWILLAVSLLWPVRAVWADSLPEDAQVEGVLGHAQAFSLSCESRSAADWAAYWGVYIDESRFLKNLPRSDNPDAGFVGNPKGAWGQVPPRPYGVHAEPVAALLRTYGLAAQAHKGLGWEDLRAEIAAGRPVIVWVIGQMWPGNSHAYTAADGQSVQVAPFEHTMILVGYTPKRVQVVDAYTGQIQKYPLQVFLDSWSVLGNMAITAQPAAETAQPATEPPPPVVTAALPSETPAPASGQAESTSAETIAQPYIQRLLMIFKDAYPLGGAPALETPTKPAVYIVQRGEGLIDIGRRLNVDWRLLAQLNGLTPPFWLRPGQALTLP